MQHQYQGNTLRPNLLIETQFSSEEEIETYKQFQFEVKDVISEASSYDIIQQNSIDKALIMNRGSMEYYDALLTGLGQLNNVIDSWQVNTMSQTFDILKSLKPKRLLLMNHGRTTSKELQSSKSVSNYKNQSGILKGLHKRKNTSTSQRDLERAEVLNEIITKLHSRQRQDGRKSASKSQFMSNKSVQKNQLVKYKIKKLDNMLKNYKQVNEQSNKQSTVYYTKHYNKRKQNKNDYQQYQDIELSRNDQSLKMSTFQKMKKDIIRVQNEVEQLKKINQIYRRQNYILKVQKQPEDIRRMSRGFGTSQPKHKEQQQKDYRQPYQLFEPRQTQYQSFSYKPQQFINYSTEIHYPNYNQNISNQSSCHHQNYQPQYPSDFRQTNNHKRSINKTVNKQSNKCHDFRHEIYWKTLVPQNEGHCVSDSNHIHIQPIVFCIKCGCKCAQKNERSNVTERKSYIPSSKQNQKTFQ